MVFRVKTKNTHAKRTSKPRWNVIFRRVFYFGLAGIVILALFWLYQVTKPSVAPINKIKIVATFQHIEKRSLQTIISPYLSNGFFYLNVIGLKRQLLTVPWVNAVSIQREWPDTIVVGVVEQKPVARWGDRALFTPEGKMFYPEATTFPTCLPVLLGTDDQARYIFNQYRQMQLQLFPLQLFIQQIYLSPQHYWHMVLNNGIQILLNEKQAKQEIAMLLNIYPKILQGHEKPPISIDLRYSNGVAVKWEEAQQLKIKN